MDKDKKGLFTYIISMIIICFLPFLCLPILSILTLPFKILPEENPTIEFLYIIICFLTVLFIFSTPFIVTIFAKVKHWSIYLDNFFNRFRLNTLILIFFWTIKFVIDSGTIPNADIYIFNDWLNDFLNNMFNIWLYWLSLSVIYCYTCVYIVIFVCNIIKYIKKLFKWINANKNL